LFNRNGTDIDYIIHKANLNKEIVMKIYDFLKVVEESNKANEMAFRYTASILKDFKKSDADGPEFDG